MGPSSNSSILLAISRNYPKHPKMRHSPRTDLERGTLVELMPHYRSVELDINAVYPTRKFLPLKVRRLIDFLAQGFRNPPWSNAIRLLPGRSAPP
jgi:hypothetical protein